MIFEVRNSSGGVFRDFRTPGLGFLVSGLVVVLEYIWKVLTGTFANFLSLASARTLAVALDLCTPYDTHPL